jgi:hypothetical protein
MNRKKMEKQLKQTFDHASNGLFDKILTDCHMERMLTTMDNHVLNTSAPVLTSEKKEKHSTTRRTRAWHRPRAALAAAAVVLFALVGVFAFQHIQSNRITTIVTLDLNPSIQLDANKHDQILAARALNDDGYRVLKDMRLEKTDLNVAINAIMGSMLRAGFLADDINTFLVSVDNQSEEKSAELRKLIAGQLEALMASNSLDGMIISQKLHVDDDVSAIADQYGISAGKAYLLRHIHASYPGIPLDVLAAMSIGELADLFEHTIAEDDDIELHGNKPGDDRQKLLDRASVLAMLAERWSLDPVSIRSASVKLEDDDQPVYVIVFQDGNLVYRAVVDARSGALLREELSQRPIPTPTEQPAATPKPTRTSTPTAAPTTRPTEPRPLVPPTCLSQVQRRQWHHNSSCFQPYQPGVW